MENENRISLRLTNPAKSATLVLASLILASEIADSQGSASASVGAGRTTQGVCQKAITFAVAESGSLDYRLPNISVDWFHKTQKKLAGLCFSQIDVASGASANRQYLVVLSLSKTAFNGLFPVFRTSTSTNTTPISGGGTATDNLGARWHFSYSGTVTTTTTTTTKTDVPYTDTTTALFANAYNETGTLIATAEKRATFRQGGDTYNTFGYNLASMFMSRNLGERLVEDILKQVRARPAAKDEAEVLAMDAKNAKIAEENAPHDSVFVAFMENARQHISLHPDDAQYKLSWANSRDAYCRSYPSANYVDLDGSPQSCGGYAKQFFVLMEESRRKIEEFKGDDRAGLVIAALRAAWLSAKEGYCQAVPEGAYIDLDGKAQSCKAK